MELVLERQHYLDTCTVGVLRVDGQWECVTLEDRWRPPTEPKVPGETCIPAGRYEVTVTWSERFQTYLPLLFDVPGFAGIRIHAGNTDEDTAGCILVGRRKVEDRIEDSRVALAELLARFRGCAAGEGHWITGGG